MTTTNQPVRTILVSSLILALALPPAAFAKTPVASGSGGAVATVSEPASQAAIAILNQGGNAIDAAVAAAATLGVTDPFSSGIGGGGLMVIYLAKDKRVITLDHREMAPASFTPTVFQQNGKEIDYGTAIASGMAVGVPGTLRGWHEALQRYGTMSFKQVLAPAIDVATKGFKLDENFVALVAENQQKFQLFPATAALYLKDGKPLPVGTTLRNPDLARTYRELAGEGIKVFYEGKIGRAIVEAVNHPPVAPGAQVRAGSMTMADLANYEARVRQPVHSTYRGYDLYGMSLPSSGGIAVAEALNILEGYDLKSMPRDQAEHLYLEAARLAFADRNAYLADPEFVDAPTAGLLSKDYAARRRELINPKQATVQEPAGDPYPFQNDSSVPLRPNAGKLLAEGAHTTHLTVSDKDGNIVSYTFTIESWGGSGITVPGYGFLLNNEMTDFDFSGPHPNVPEAGKRPRSSMSPTLAFRNGKPAFSVGSPGGGTIITTVLQTIVNYVDLGMRMDQAIDAPRISERNGMVSDVERGFSGSAQARALEKYGQRWSERPADITILDTVGYNPDGSIGAANALVFNADGTVTAVSEGHRQGGGSAMVQKKGH